MCCVFHGHYIVYKILFRYASVSLLRKAIILCRLYFLYSCVSTQLLPTLCIILCIVFPYRIHTLGCRRLLGFYLLNLFLSPWTFLAARCPLTDDVAHLYLSPVYRAACSVRLSLLVGWFSKFSSFWYYLGGAFLSCPPHPSAKG